MAFSRNHVYRPNLVKKSYAHQLKFLFALYECKLPTPAYDLNKSQDLSGLTVSEVLIFVHL